MNNFIDVIISLQKQLWDNGFITEYWQKNKEVTFNKVKKGIKDFPLFYLRT